MNTAMQPLDETVGYALAQVCKAHRHRVDLALSTLGLHVGQEMILHQLWQAEGVTQSQLAEGMCVEPPTVTKMLQRLERDALIERRPDADDARISRVFLTPQARALRCEVERCWDTIEQRAVAGMTAEERMLLRRLLIQMRANLSEGEPS